MNIIDDNGNLIPDNTTKSKRVITSLLALFFGCFGIHKFVLGYTREGVILLAITVVTCGIGASITAIIGLIEGIVYLTKSDEEFIYEYQTNKKPWF